MIEFYLERATTDAIWIAEELRDLEKTKEIAKERLLIKISQTEYFMAFSSGWGHSIDLGEWYLGAQASWQVLKACLKTIAGYKLYTNWSFADVLSGENLVFYREESTEEGLKVRRVMASIGVGDFGKVGLFLKAKTFSFSPEEKEKIEEVLRVEESNEEERDRKRKARLVYQAIDKLLSEKKEVSLQSIEEKTKLDRLSVVRAIGYLVKNSLLLLSPKDLTLLHYLPETREVLKEKEEEKGFSPQR